MGDGVSEKPKPTTYSQVFREAFPHYLVMGMSAAEYWDGEPWLARSYREAYRIRMENQSRMSDREAWHLGEYIRQAIASVPIVVNGFVPKNHHMHEYPEKPLLEIYEETKREEEVRKQEDNKQQVALAVFQTFVNKMNEGILKRLDAEKKAEAT